MMVATVVSINRDINAQLWPHGDIYLILPFGFKKVYYNKDYHIPYIFYKLVILWVFKDAHQYFH
jgi:hypothetical protein